MKYYGFFGFIATLFTGGLFCAVEVWAGTKSIISREWFFLNRRKANIYNSYKLFDDDLSSKDPNEIIAVYDNMALEVPVEKPKRKGKRKRRRRRRGRRAF